MTNKWCKTWQRVVSIFTGTGNAVSWCSAAMATKPLHSSNFNAVQTWVWGQWKIGYCWRGVKIRMASWEKRCEWIIVTSEPPTISLQNLLMVSGYKGLYDRHPAVTTATFNDTMLIGSRWERDDCLQSYWIALGCFCQHRKCLHWPASWMPHAKHCFLIASAHHLSKTQITTDIP